MENKQYNWFVKQGNIQIQRVDMGVELKLDYQGANSCLLTGEDTIEFIEILILLSKEIWEDPKYIRVPYKQQVYSITHNTFQWRIGDSILEIAPNAIKNAIEVSAIGKYKLNIEVNYIIEIVQILEALITGDE